MSKYEMKDIPVSYLVGVLVGVNAIKDSYLWVDSPDCFFFKNDFIQGNHDITSRLRKEDGKHKFLATISDVDNVIGNRNEKFIKSLKHLANTDFVKQIFVSSMPMNQIVGTDYDGIIKEVVSSLGNNKPIFNIPSKSMSDCWLEGYSDLLFSLAKNIDISLGKKQEKNVAIVGNLFDRGEGDCIANIQELERIIDGLGLNLVSIWLDGGNYEDVLKIKNAQTIISLPYGRKAAKKIAHRLGSKLIELDLPFGLDKTGDFIRTLGKEFSLEKKAEDFIKKELTEFNKIDIIKRVINHTFQGKNISFYGDPYLLNGFLDLSKSLGFFVNKVYIHGDEKHLKNNKNLDLDGKEIFYGLEGDNFNDLDLLISVSNGNRIKEIGVKKMQFGFPSYDYHIYTYEPYFGYRGALIFINRMANIINS